jgi:hypothetical protein
MTIYKRTGKSIGYRSAQTAYRSSNYRSATRLSF